MGRHPQGSCAKRLTTESRQMPWHPQRRHHRSSPVIRHADTAWSGSMRWPVTSRPRSSRRVNALRSGRSKIVIGHVEVFQMDGVAISIIGRPRPLPGHDTPNAAHNTCGLPPTNTFRPITLTSRCTRSVAIHPIRRGVMPTDRVHRLPQQVQPRALPPDTPEPAASDAATQPRHANPALRI